MWTIIFVATTVMCGIGWLTRYVSCAALIYYMNKKGYTPPMDKELKECTQFVVMKIFRR